MITPQRPAALIAALSLLALLSGGCGQKGPLYLEQPEPRQPIAPAASKTKKPVQPPVPATTQQPDQVEQSFPQKDQY